MLAAAGLHGLTEHWVHASQRELGIRRAAGATNRSVIAWFVARWMRVVAPAALVGTALQIGLLQMAAATVEGVTPAGVLQSLAGATAVLVYAVGVTITPLLSALKTDARQLNTLRR